MNATHRKEVDDLLPVVEDLKTINPFAVLYQAGYFTIKEKVSSVSFAVGLPNLEVKKAYSKILIKLLAEDKQSTSEDEQSTIQEELDAFEASLKTCDIPRSVTRSM